MDEALIMIQGLKELCDKWFTNPMIQPFAGANTECMFCGEKERRKWVGGLLSFHVDHQSDCPYKIYKKILDR